jgi:hypothetical protein
LSFLIFLDNNDDLKFGEFRYLRRYRWVGVRARLLLLPSSSSSSSLMAMMMAVMMIMTTTTISLLATCAGEQLMMVAAAAVQTNPVQKRKTLVNLIEKDKSG